MVGVGWDGQDAGENSLVDVGKMCSDIWNGVSLFDLLGS